jgi:6-phosphogluconate dehydrogenase
MLQAIDEGMVLLENYRDRRDIANVLQCWRNGSVIRSWPIDLMHEGYVREGGLEQVPPFVEDTGEVNWLVDDSLRMEVAMPVISAAVMQLIASRDESEPWARAIALMRKGFGGHAYGASEAIVEERRTGRVDGFVRD